jgi:RES domain-containing protein
MKMYRLVHKAFADTPFSGIGAKLHGGRWNSKNVACIYCSDSESLCSLEVLVHIKSDPEIAELYDLYRIDIADELISALEAPDHPPMWRNIPVHESTQTLGDDFLTAPNNPFAALQVPSIISPRDHNYLINLNHQAMRQVFEKAQKLDFKFDLRVFD